MKSWVTKLAAPLSTPPPLHNAKLLSYFLFIRHGARAPLYPWPNYGENVEWKFGESYKDKSIKRRIPVANGKEIDFSKNPKSGRLLDNGIKQQEDLGNLYYNYLSVQNKLLPSKNEYDLSQIYIRSSVAPRCIESATSFLQGMYSPRTNGEKLYMQTGQFGSEILCPHPQGNDFFIKKCETFQKTSEFRRRISVIPQEIKSYFPKKEIIQLLAGDFPYCLQFNGYKLPKIIEEDNKKCQNLSHGNEKCYGEIYRNLASNLAYYSTGFIDYVGKPAYGPIFDLFGDHLKKCLDKKADVKFTLFSGHDVTISGILVGLGHVYMGAVPPYASHLGVGLWQTDSKLVLRFAINGDVLKFNNSDTIDVEKFIKKYID